MQPGDCMSACVWLLVYVCMCVLVFLLMFFWNVKRNAVDSVVCRRRSCQCQVNIHWLRRWESQSKSSHGTSQAFHETASPSIMESLLPTPEDGKIFLTSPVNDCLIMINKETKLSINPSNQSVNHLCDPMNASVALLTAVSVCACVSFCPYLSRFIYLFLFYGIFLASFVTRDLFVIYKTLNFGQSKTLKARTIHVGWTFWVSGHQFYSLPAFLSCLCHFDLN